MIEADREPYAPCRCTHPKLAHNVGGRCECGCPEYRKAEMPRWKQ